jgi:hypothetical protein
VLMQSISDQRHEHAQVVEEIMSCLRNFDASVSYFCRDLATPSAGALGLDVSGHLRELLIDDETGSGIVRKGRFRMPRGR